MLYVWNFELNVWERIRDTVETLSWLVEKRICHKFETFSWVVEKRMPYRLEKIVKLSGSMECKLLYFAHLECIYLKSVVINDREYGMRLKLWSDWLENENAIRLKLWADCCKKWNCWKILILDWLQIEIAGSFAELDCYSETSEADYDVFAEAVNNSRRAAAERTAPPPGRAPGPPGMANGEVVLRERKTGWTWKFCDSANVVVCSCISNVENLVCKD